MYIFIEAITGLTIRIQISEYEIIKSIKHRIMISEDIPIDDQHLIYQDKVLSDHLKLIDYGIGNGAVLKLILKMRGGPLSPEMIYDEESTVDFFPDNDSDKILFLFTENGNINMVPMPRLEVQQNQNISKNEFNLADQHIYSPPSSAQTKELDDQNIKLTTLRLKMDKIRLSKRISSMYGNGSADRSSKQSSNKNNPVKREESVSRNRDSDSIINNNKTPKPLLSVNTNPNYPTHQKPSLQRSISLDSRSVGYIQNQSDDAKSGKGKVVKSPNTERSPKLGLHRTMSYLDTLKFNHFSTKFPHLNDLPRKRTALSKYVASFNVPSQSPFQKAAISKDKYAKENNETQNSPPLMSNRPALLPRLDESELEIKPKKVRCSICNKKLTMTIEFTCRCNKKFCPKHRYPEEHSCSFDFKSEGRALLIKENPLIKAEKLSKI